MKFANDEDDQNDLALLAWQESVRLGDRASMPILVNFLKLRSREMNRSFVGAKCGGKSVRDVWHQKPLSLRKVIIDSSRTLGDFLSSCAEDPYGLCRCSEVEEALDMEEEAVAGMIVAGYTENESVDRLGVGYEQFRKLKQVVRNKAMEYLA